jgi:antitoxin PrlF
VELSKLSSKGQITIPKQIRNVLDVEEGDHIAFIEEDGLVIMIKGTLQSLHDLQNSVEEGKINRLIEKLHKNAKVNGKVE